MIGLTRRQLLQQAGAGFGMLGLAGLHASPVPANPARAKSVIFLYMNGGPSGIDCFDYKPALETLHGKPFPGEIDTLFPYPGPIMASPFKFKRHGESGAWVSECYPHVARHVDKMAFLYACHTDVQNHTPACYMLNTGLSRFGAPGVGSWLSYGLGSENADVPAYVVILDENAAPEGGANLWDAGFLPSNHSGVRFLPREEPISFLGNRQGPSLRKKDLLRKLNRMHAELAPPSDIWEARIQSHETAFRMQMSLPGIADFASETAETHELYGLDDQSTSPFGKQCLLARRLVEAGARCIQVYNGGYRSNWDHHEGLESGHREHTLATDRPIAGLLEDLDRRGLLESTLVVWGGEFGRSPTSQDGDGRDHNPHGFCMWLAGGGVKSGTHYGSLDELGHRPISGPVSMADLHATILELMGIDHEGLTFNFNGRDQSLTNGLGNPIEAILS